jgi:uncharacterized protein YkwD
VNRRILSGVGIAAGAIACALAITTVSGAEALRPHAPPPITVRHALDLQIIARVNTVRSQQGMPQLTLNAGLATAATEHSSEMATSGLFRHTSVDGDSFSARVMRYYPAAGYHSWAVGEDLFWRSPDADAAAVVSAWLASASHRRILLDPRWREIGVSAVHATRAPGDFLGREATIVTADFGARTR